MGLFRSSHLTRIERLSRLDRFPGVTPADVRRIVEAGTMVRIQRGDVLIAQDHPADGAYVVISGELSVTRNGHEVGVMTPGDLVGEIGVVVGPLRTTTVTALGDVEALYLDAGIARGFYDELPAFRQALWETAAERLLRDQYND